MNRRNFLEKGSFAALAVAGLPHALKKQAPNTPYIYKNDLVSGKAGQTQYAITVYHSTVEQFSAAKPEEKFLRLSIKFYETTDLYTPAKTGDFKYLVESVEKNDKENNIWKLKTKLEQKVSGDYELGKDFPKDLKFLIKPWSYAEILSKKDKALVYMPYHSSYSSSSGDDDCFLTTACVHHKQLADNCEELQTLRFLRNEYMMRSGEGQLLVEQYQSIGPEIVSAIINTKIKARYMNTCTGT